MVHCALDSSSSTVFPETMTSMEADVRFSRTKHRVVSPSNTQPLTSAHSGDWSIEKRSTCSTEITDRRHRMATIVVVGGWDTIAASAHESSCIYKSFLFLILVSVVCYDDVITIIIIL